MIDLEWIKDEAVSVFPEGVPVEAVPDFAELIVRLVEITQMKYVLQNGRWVNPHGVVAAPPAVSGCKEIAEAGTMLVGTGSARPKPGDLKPSESLLRDLNATAQAPLIKAREEARARWEEINRQIENGQTEVHPEATPGNAVSIPGENGRRVIVPEHKLTAADKQAIAAEQAARATPPPRPEPRDVGAGLDGMTSEERRKVAAALARPGIDVGGGVREVVRVVDRVPEGCEVIPAKPDYRAPSRSDVESWDLSAMKCIPKGS